jgi:diacylglycerol kinase family enzyme
MSLALWGVTVVFLVIALYRNLPALIVALLGLGLVAAGAWWALTEIGARRILAWCGSVAGIALIILGLTMAFNGPDHVVFGTAAMLAVVGVTVALTRFALIEPVAHHSIPSASHRRRPSHAVLMCNPWSGGGKVEKNGLVEFAAELGVETVLLAPGLDLEALTRDAVARGADCLAMAGGDGSQALVASVAAEHDLPFVCIPAGTRNHFALDLGLDREDPRAAMSAFHDAIERRVDFATVNGRLFVNNVSLGVYATIVQSEDYRDAKVDVTRSMLGELLGRGAEPFDLQYSTPDGRAIDGAYLIMVSNNPYVLGAKRDVSQRRRLDSGRLGVFAVSTQTSVHAARLMTLSAMGLRRLSSHWYEFTADKFEVHSHAGSAFLGVDGEALESPTPLQFEIHPLGLRMFVPGGNLEAAEKRRVKDLQWSNVVGVARGRGSQPTLVRPQ